MPKEEKKGRVRGNGDGLIRKRADGRYEFRIMDGYKSDGKPCMRVFYGKTGPEAKRKYKQWLEEKQETRIEKITTVAEWAPVWLESYKHGSVAEGTYRNYKLYAEQHVAPYFGKAKINNIMPADIERFMSTKAGFSYSARHQIWLVLHEMFEAAIENHLCKQNPCKKRRTPTEEKDRKIQTWPRDDIEKLLLYLPKVRWGYIVELLLYSGLREGELIGLRWSDIDHGAGVLHVAQSIGKTEHGVAPKATKSGHDRNVGLTDELKKVLAATPHNGKYVLADTLTGYLTPHQLQYRYRTVIEEVNAAIIADKGKPIKYLSPHKCRHTFATYLARGGASAKDVQKILGHSSLSTTQIYFDVDTEDIKSASEKLSY